jgi:DNA-binding SARP family transcriptional activator/tetratricopeptide (TPR) repeat protein
MSGSGAGSSMITRLAPTVSDDVVTGVGVELRALGPVEAVVGGELVDLGPPRQRALFALLLSRVDRPVAVDTLIEELWSGEPPAAAMASLRAYVSNLRRVLEPHRPPRAPAAVLRTRAPGYLLDSRQAEVDFRRFGGHATAGYETLAGGDPQQALEEFETALGLWRGTPYAEVRDAEWAAAEIAWLEELRLSVIEGRFTALLELGAHAVAVAELEAHVRAHPLREHGCELLALALYRGGRQAEALGMLRATRVRLAEELGIDPGPALQRLGHEILTQAPTLEWQPPRLVSTVSAPALTRASAQLPTTTGPELADEEIFVGRESALRRLVDALGAAVQGRGRMVLVAGEPGIGKTRLLRRFGELASVSVVWGSCPEHVAAPPLWPWEQALRAVQACWPDRPVPDPVTALLGGEPLEMSELDVAGAALRRYEAIGEYLSAGSDPLVVVLDDLHWADMASLQLLTHLAGRLTISRLLVVASYRSHEAASLTDVLAALARVGAIRIELGGLDAEEVQVLAAAVLGRKVSKDTAEELWVRTEGNPFFLRELVELLAGEQRLEQPGTVPVPESVREVVLRRITRLPEPTAAVLSVAAVAGREFDIQVVAEAAAIEIEPALEAIDTAVAAGLVVEDEQRLGWFRFTHMLVAEALYHKIGRLRRTQQHRRIGQAAARIWAGQDERAGEIARHWLLAAELSRATAAQAVAHTAAAARVADARLAPEDAAELWRQALAGADLAGDDVDRYPLLIGLATSLYRAARPFEGLPVFIQAMEYVLTQAGSAGIDSARFVTAALGAIGEPAWYPSDYGVIDERLVGVLQRALPRLTEPVERALVLSCLAVVRYFDDNPAGRAALSNEALALARSAADSLTLAQVLRLQILALYGPDYSEQCLEAGTELLQLPDLPGPLVASARLLRARVLMTLGRVADAAAEFDRVIPLVERLQSLPLRIQLDWSRAGLLLLAGRWQEAEVISRATFAAQARIGWPIARAARMAQRWETAYLTGSGADLVDELRSAAEATHVPPALRSILVMALVQAGRAEEARRALRRLAPRPRDYQWLYTKCWSLLAASRLGETELVAQLRAELLPYRGLACMVGWAVISGSVAYFTGEGALALGDPDTALADLATAIESDERMGALPWLAQAHAAITRAQQLKNRTR